MQLETLTYLGVFALVAYSVFVVWLILNAAEFTNGQRALRISIVVLLPGLGGAWSGQSLILNRELAS
jgi:hypothetical protein